MVTEPTGKSSVRKGPQTRGWESPLEAEKGGEKASFLEPPERSAVLSESTAAQLRPMSDFRHPEVEENKFVIF